MIYCTRLATNTLAGTYRLNVVIVPQSRSLCTGTNVLLHATLSTAVGKASYAAKVVARMAPAAYRVAGFGIRRFSSDSTAAAAKTVKIDIKTATEAFLNISKVPDVLKAPAGLVGKKYIYLRDCYEPMLDAIINPPRYNPLGNNFAVVGSPGIGKSAMLMYILHRLIEDPMGMKQTTPSFYFQSSEAEILFFEHVSGKTFNITPIKAKAAALKAYIPLFVDIPAFKYYSPPRQRDRLTITFYPYQPDYKGKLGGSTHYVMPVWTDEELSDFVSSKRAKTNYGDDITNKVLGNCHYFGGNIRRCINETNGEEVIEAAMKVHGAYVGKNFFRPGLWRDDDKDLSLFIHWNPDKTKSGKYDFSRSSYNYASRHVMDRLFTTSDTHRHECALFMRDERAFGPLILGRKELFMDSYIQY